MNVQTCCGLFRDLLSVDGKAGMSIAPINSPKFGHFFRLQFSVAATSDLPQLKVLSEHRAVLEVRQYIQFCPFCGVKLAKFYRNTFLDLPHLTLEEL